MYSYNANKIIDAPAILQLSVFVSMPIGLSHEKFVSPVLFFRVEFWLCIVVVVSHT